MITTDSNDIQLRKSQMLFCKVEEGASLLLKVINCDMEFKKN